MLPTDRKEEEEEEAMGQVRFTGRIRHWREDPPGGLAVVDVPDELVPELGGRRQYRVEGTLNGAPYAGSTMLVAGGGFAIGVSKAALTSAGAGVGDDVDVAIGRAVDSGARRSSGG